MNYFYSLFGACRRNAKRALLTAAASCALFATASAAENTHLIIHFTDGTTTSFVLADKPAVSFVDNNVRVRARHIDTDFEAARVAKFMFGDALASVADLAANEVRFTIPDNDHIYAAGLKSGEAVRVVSIDGRIVATVHADADGAAEIDFTELPNGIYVVATQSGQTLKMKH